MEFKCIASGTTLKDIVWIYLGSWGHFLADNIPRKPSSGLFQIISSGILELFVYAFMSLLNNNNHFNSLGWMVANKHTIKSIESFQLIGALKL